MPSTTLSEHDIIVAMIATQNGKLDCQKMAALLGVTYSSLEHRLRKMKAEAASMIKTAEEEGRIDKDGVVVKEALPHPAKKRAKDPAQGVMTGRIVKSTAKKPTIKRENLDAAVSSVLQDLNPTNVVPTIEPQHPGGLPGPDYDEEDDMMV